MTLEAFPRSGLYFLPRKYAGVRTAPSKSRRSKALRFEAVLPTRVWAPDAGNGGPLQPGVLGGCSAALPALTAPGNPRSLASPPDPASSRSAPAPQRLPPVQTPRLAQQAREARWALRPYLDLCAAASFALPEFLRLPTGGRQKRERGAWRVFIS